MQKDALKMNTTWKNTGASCPLEILATVPNRVFNRARVFFYFWLLFAAKLFFVVSIVIAV